MTGKGRGLFRFTQALGLPREVLPGGFLLVLSGREELTVRGCKRILSYAPDCITLSLHQARLVVRGEDLYCSAFGGGSVTLGGRVEGLCLEEV